MKSKGLFISHLLREQLYLHINKIQTRKQESWIEWRSSEIGDKLDD